MSSEVKQAGATASLVADGGTRMQQMQHKAQALQQCIEDKLHQVIKIASSSSDVAVVVVIVVVAAVTFITVAIINMQT